MKRRTIQRALVLSAVMELNDHPTAEEVYRYAAQRTPTISRGTVYRNLSQLAEEGTISRIPVPNAPDRFDSATEMCIRDSAMTVSMQNIMIFASDEKADWKKYQRVLPISDVSVITSKYVSVLITLAVSVLGSIVFAAISGFIHSARCV